MTEPLNYSLTNLFKNSNPFYRFIQERNITAVLLETHNTRVFPVVRWELFLFVEQKWTK